MSLISKPEIYLDLDDTCLRTYDAWPKIWQIVAQFDQSINPVKESSRRRLLDFYTYPSDGPYGVYNFDAHLKHFQITSEKQIKQVYEQIQNSDLANGELEYAGLKDLIDYTKKHFSKVSILTYGMHHIQKLKISLLPSLKNIEMIAILGSKADYFKLHKVTNAWMIDDKPIGNELPDGVNLIQVSLRGVELPKNANWLCATSLQEVSSILRRNIDEN